MSYFTQPRAAFVVPLVVVTLLSLFVSRADAGTVLLARESHIRAVGTAGSEDFDLQDGSQDFNGFADTVDSADAGVEGPHVAANQNSRPSLSDGSGDFIGAYAEGAASAEAADGGPVDPDYCVATSAFDLTFEVLKVPSVVTFGGAVGVSGEGSALFELCNDSTGELVLSEEVLPGDTDGAAIQHSALLKPGVYSLSVEAAANGEDADSMAYYTMSFSLAAVPHGTDGGGHAIPLPPAALSIAMMLGAGGVISGSRKLVAMRHR